ncbi:MAG: hypothetical protein Q9221_004612 [Calogaya cf. arnoldii]
MIQEGAFDEAMQGPAVSGTINILKAATKVQSVKRVIITSSVSVFMTDDQTTVHDETTMATVPDDSFIGKDHYAAYHTSKVLAYRATQDFLRTTSKPHFTITNIMPSFVVGKHELLTTPDDIISPKTTNLVPMAPIFGDGMPFAFPGLTVHVDDVAKVHIAALDPNIDGNQDFVLTAGGTDGIQWNDAKEIVRRRFPDAVEKGLLPCQGSTETKMMKVDGSKAEKIFDFKYKDFEEQIVSIVGQYLEAVEKSNQ